MNNSSINSELIDVLIVGASARSAAMSAARAGWRVWAADLFGDADLRETACEYRQIKNYRELPAVLAGWPNVPWLATGALENHPRLIERLSLGRPHWGNPAEVVRRVRNPAWLSRCLKSADLPALEIRLGESPPPADGRWMLKPRRSAGGQGIFIWDQETVRSPGHPTILRKPHYFQQRAEGDAMSAVLLSEWNRISLLGTSKLFFANAPGPRFGYGGAIGPVKITSEQEHHILQVGQVVGAASGLRGLWGLDFLSDGVGIWPMEINPRYTATVELYEQALSTAFLPFHRRACESWRTSNEVKPPVEIERWNAKFQCCVGKVVIYADRELVVPPWREWESDRDPLLPGFPTLADRPPPGSVIPAGFPICSLLAAGGTEAQARRALNKRLEAFQTHFKNAGVPIFVPFVPGGFE